MSTRHSDAHWEGTLKDGHGSMKLGSGVFEGAFSFKTRFEDDPGTNPEELIAAAHAGCFSMAFSAMLEEAGSAPVSVDTRAAAKLEEVDGGFAITHIKLSTEAEVPGMDESKFLKVANQAKEGCPVSKALAGVKIELDAKLKA